MQQMQLKGNGETYYGARIATNSKSYPPVESNPGEIFALNLFLGNSVQRSSFSRYDLLKVLSTVGGFERFAAGFIVIVLSYFTEIDYLAEFTKELFL